jgi:hypothetical protein
MESTPEEKIFERMLEFFQSGKENWHKDEVVRTINSFRAELGWIGIQKSNWKEVVHCWNACVKLPKVLSLSGSRQRTVEARLRDKYFRQNYQEAIMRILESPFLMGQNQKGWIANFDWFIQPDSIAKIMEGRYADRTATVAITMKVQPKPVNAYEVEKSIKFVESEIDRLKSDKNLYKRYRNVDAES